MSTTVKLNHCPKCGAPIPADAPQGLCPKCVLLGAATSAESGHAPTATSEIPTIARLAAAFPQLEIIELIGRGGMGFVFKARQPHLDRFVALKLLPDKLARDPRFAERFGREGRVLAKLNHPNIVSIYDFGSTEHFYFLLMEYVDGVNLRQAMQAGRFSPGEALAIVPKICEALQYAHEQGILHRDIKPENILLDARGQVKIADFGIAKLVGEDKPDVALTATGAALGTPHYMAPEQLEQPTEVDHRADIYSLGVVFYEMLTGELPIGRFAAPSSKTPVGANVDEVVFRTLEKDRERRFQSAGEMKTQVEHLSGPDAGGARDLARSGTSGDHVGAVAPRWSRKAVWSAVLTGLSLPTPLLFLVLAYLGAGGLGAWELGIGLGAISMPGLAGFILGWIALSDIRAHRGRLRGSPLAAFAALTWPLVLLVGGTLVAPWFIAHRTAPPGADVSVRTIPMLLVMAGTITFAVWAVHATVRWTGNQPVSQRRGVLKWVFLGLLLAGLGVLLLPRLVRENAVQVPAMGTAADLIPSAPAVSPMIQFTFTTVELRDEDGARWLTMDYVEQARGDCERSFRYDSSVPGFAVQTRTTSFMTDAKAGFAPVLHQRVAWKLPDSLPQSDALTLRELVGKERIGKPIVLGPGEEFPLFKTVVPSGGSLVAAVGVKLQERAAIAAAQLEHLLERERELLTHFTPDNPTVKEVREKIANVQRELKRNRDATPPSRDAASTELWAPNLAPGEIPKAYEILQEASSLAGQGLYEQALQRHIWYHHHALAFQPSQAGVRLSFALIQWMELARRYPKAKDALVEIRDQCAGEFSVGGSFALFTEVNFINKALKEDYATIALFKSVRERNPKLARQCFRLVEDLLVETGEYALCASFVPDVQDRFAQICAKREKMLEAARGPKAAPALLRNEAQRLFVNETRNLIEILVGVGRKVEAVEIHDQALAVLNEPELQAAVDDAETRVKSMKAQLEPK